MPGTPVLRPIADADLPALLALNAGAVPAVGAVGPDGLRRLAAMACWAMTTPAADAFLIALAPGAPYGSPNYRWVSARWRRFAYVDRIVVAPGLRGTGVGRALYEALFADLAAQGVPRVTCEVNVRPPNRGSLAFHARLGFRRTGVRSDGPGGTTVAMLVRPLPGGVSPG